MFPAAQTGSARCVRTTRRLRSLFYIVSGVRRRDSIMHCPLPCRFCTIDSRASPPRIMVDGTALPSRDSFGLHRCTVSAYVRIECADYYILFLRCFALPHRLRCIRCVVIAASAVLSCSCCTASGLCLLFGLLRFSGLFGFLCYSDFFAYPVYRMIWMHEVIQIIRVIVYIRIRMPDVSHISTHSISGLLITWND